MRNLTLALSVLFLGLSAEAAAGTVGIDVGFSDGEIKIIRAYYSSEGGAKARGNGKKSKGLPPGVARNLARGKPLPPGIARQFLPGDLIASLPPVRDGHERVIVDGKILLIEVATQVIRDILTDVIL